VQEIIGKALLDDVTLVAGANNEIVDPERRISLHDVPNDRLASDLDHWLGLSIRFFAYTSSQTTSQYHTLHIQL
jgi:hypothetical protein